jgi:hypothetical protein
MNKLITVSIAAIALLIVGCSTTPTAADRAVADVRTNYVPVLALQTNVVTVVQTNTVIQTVTQTNAVGVPVPVYFTNLTSVVAYQTNIVLTTNQAPVYSLVPNSTSTAVAGIAGAASNLAVPGVGELVTGGLLALLSIFLGYRNRQMSGQNSALSQAAGVLAQTIETGRAIMATTPQGKQAADAFTSWMVSHQAETDTIGTITKIVKDSTSNVQAQAAANQILGLIGQPPTPPPAKPTA